MSADYLEAGVDKFIFCVIPEVLSPELGVWVAMDKSSGITRLGLIDYRKQPSGDGTLVDLPAEGNQILAGKELKTIETIKVDLEAPASFDGEIVTANMTLLDSPKLIN